MASAFVGKAGIRDVADFHLRWQEFRPTAAAAAGKAALGPDERWVVSWLIALADRVGEADVRPRATEEASSPEMDGSTDHA